MHWIEKIYAVNREYWKAESNKESNPGHWWSQVGKPRQFKHRLFQLQSNILVAWFTLVLEGNNCTLSISKTTSFFAVSSSLLIWNKEKWRKQQGNHLPACLIQLASDTNISHATRGNYSVVKTTNLFFIVNWLAGAASISKPIEQVSLS